MTTDIQPHIGDAQVSHEPRTFHINIFGNFSGLDQERAELTARTFSKNTWDKLFSDLAPRWNGTVVLPKVDDLKVSLSFGSLKEFSAKGIAAQIPLLAAIKSAKERIEAANKENTVSPAGLVAEFPALKTVQSMAAAQGENKVIDLLSMVDLGDEEEEEESSLRLPNLKTFFGTTVYEGDKRSKVAYELDEIQRHVMTQIQAEKSLNELHGQWRGLKLFLRYLTPNLKVSIVDCMKSEVCDAVFLLHVKPETHDPLPMDLAIFCDYFGNTDDDRHLLHYLGRMGETLSVPMLLNGSPQIFMAKSWRLLAMTRDFSGKLSTPAHIKWRKLRDEESSSWLFLALNPFLVSDPDVPEEQRVFAPPSYYLGLVMIYHLSQDAWPSELLGPLGHLSISPGCVVEFSKDQGDDLAFEGFTAISGFEKRDFLSILGMTCFGTIKIPASDKLDARNLVEYSLPYRFFAGCCSRQLRTLHPDADLVEALRAYARLEAGTEIREEQGDEGQRLLQFRAPFPVFNSFPNLILAVD
ncbi:Type VI secretion system contractile sheath large subunit [Sulfidibacter corallicola]|uniref:Type VI secretion system contractile sheath large subunit n=1 Tax=Sulfidibacter corallicola TaxID=2818388 RepID=A0A8A4TWM8_SULCO|nr:type VI secretion system contractile sheath large subunit [Sulfidibacter corallicola]QTD53372.1 type VI secretion system contractile sheath large subunit [Sulfidibacter corallicola]